MSKTFFGSIYDHQNTNSILNCIDIYAKPIMLVKNGQKYQRSSIGGLLTLLVSFLLMLYVVQFYTNSGFTGPFNNNTAASYNNRRRQLEAGGTITKSLQTPLLTQNGTNGTTEDDKARSDLLKINFDNGTYFSERNIWFSDTKKKPVNVSEYKAPLLASNRSGIDNMYLVF